VQRKRFPLLLATAAVWLLACSERELRGSVVASPDGGTYLVVDDDNGGACGPILVDGKPWPYPIHVLGALAPGPHIIDCSGEISFALAEGTTFHFDYWGP
jgi:hypothetical protein